MRKGFNPKKDQKLTKLDFFHQVIVPVYIPINEGYFKDSFEIFKLHLNSLFKTIHPKTFITIVNNGSSKEVEEYLDKLFTDKKIQEVIHTQNIGKLNAILKGVSGHNFPLITISDADVLFLNNWQKETYEVFEKLPKAGFVSPCPSSKVLKKFTYNLIFDNLFSSHLRFTEVKNPDAMKMFAQSIGNPDFYNDYHLKQYLTITKNDKTAVVGGGHFVGTYRGEVFKNISQKYSEFSLGGASENTILDKPVVDFGFWRLSTHDNYARHLGNTVEDWMKDVEIEQEQRDLEFPIIEVETKTKKSSKFKELFFRFFLNRKGIWKRFLLYKGLNKKAIKDY